MIIEPVKTSFQMNYSAFSNYIYELGRQKSLITEPELIAAGASKDAVARLVKTGVLELVTQGIYMPENADFGEHHTRVEVATRFPDTVLCLASALSFYRLTTQMPRLVWIAYQEKTLRPVEPKLPIEAIPMSEPGFSRGIETHIIEGLPVRIYSQAKTIADCFTYEHHIGIDVAVEALDQAIREERLQISQVLDYIEPEKLNSNTAKNLDERIKYLSVTTA